jgi:hypothetical protein
MRNRKLFSGRAVAAAAALLHVAIGSFVWGSGTEFGPGICTPKQNCTNCLFGLMTTGDAGLVCTRMRPPSAGACALFGGATTTQQTIKTCIPGNYSSPCASSGPTVQCNNTYYTICGGCANPGCENQQNCACPGAGSNDGQGSLPVNNSCT